MEKSSHTPIFTQHSISIIILLLSFSFFLCSLVFLFYHLANTNNGSIAIPAGKTYLGPSELQPEWTNFSPPTPQPEINDQSLFTADTSTLWKTWTGKTYPYAFSYPETLPLAGFPNDPSDSVGMSWKGKKPQEHILINVIDLSKNTAFTPYISTSKKEFVQNWWKQFSGLKGVSSLTEFTNTKGLKGYKTRFINSDGQSPNLDIFFEVPKNPNLMIRIANGIIDPTVFDTMVESVEWKK